MAKKSQDARGVLSLFGVAIVLAAIAILFWAVPIVMPTPGLEGSPYIKMFNGLTDFGGNYQGRMLAFVVAVFSSLVAAFSAIILLLLRRR